MRELFPPQGTGWRIGAVYLFGTIGMGLGGWLGGFMFDASGGYRLAFLVGGGFNVGNLLLVTALFLRRGRQHGRAGVAYAA